MIKLLFCLRRRPELSREEFQAYWRDVHAPLVRSVAAELAIVRYVQSHRQVRPELESILKARGVTKEPFDGVAELWWNTFEEMNAAGNTAEGRAAGRALFADEQRFIDLTNSELVFAEEYEVIPEAIALLAGPPAP